MIWDRSRVVSRLATTEVTHEQLLRVWNTLEGATRRKYMGMITNTVFDGNQRATHDELGWNRETIRKEQSELQLGRDDEDWRKHNGGTKIERTPTLLKDIKQVVEPNSHTDPKLTSDRVYMRLSVNDICDALIEQFS